MGRIVTNASTFCFENHFQAVYSSALLRIQFLIETPALPRSPLLPIGFVFKNSNYLKKTFLKCMYCIVCVPSVYEGQIFIFPGTRATDGREPSHECWESNLSPLKEQLFVTQAI